MPCHKSRQLGGGGENAFATWSEVLEPRRLLAAGLVKDINEAGLGSISTEPGVVANGLLFYDARGGTWVTDGTTTGTRLLAPYVFVRDRSVHTDGFAYFSAENKGSLELWKSDGGPAGMILVKEINPATGTFGGSDPFGFTSLGQHLLFFANNGTDGNELWRTDGTAAGTVMVKNIRPGTQSGVAKRTLPLGYPVTATIGGAMYFVADAEGDGGDLWKTDGTLEGTVLVKKGTGTPAWIAVMNGVMYFQGAGFGLWRSDGTEAGTYMFGPPMRAITVPKVVGDLLYFSNQDDYELWRSDGSPEGTFRVKDVNPGPTAFSFASPLDAFGDELLFTADDEQGPGIWKTDGTEAGTTLLRRLRPETGFVTARRVQRIGDRLYLTLTGDDTHGRELWVTDGTGEGTHLVADINPGPLGSTPHLLGELNGRLLFGADDFVHGAELWISDGTAAGTRLVLDATPGTHDSNPSDFALLGDYAYFGANDGASRSLWRTDGTAAGTTLVHDVGASGMVRLGDHLLFGGYDGGVYGSELWRSDGTEAGTTLVRDIHPGTGNAIDESYTDFVVAGRHVFFLADDGTHGRELWASDGTAAGTRMLADIAPGPAHGLGDVRFTVPRPYTPERFAATESGLLVFEVSGDVWRSDGTPEGTYLLRDMRTTANTLYPRYFEAVGDVIYFAGPGNSDGTGGIGGQGQLWKTDGTVEGTVLVKDVVPTTQDEPGNAIAPLTSFDGAVYFIEVYQVSPTGSSARYDVWLSRSDGTEASTVRVRRLKASTTGSGPGAIVVAGELMYFLMRDDETRRTQLWRSDGTADGTRSIGESYDWDTSYPNLRELNGRLVMYHGRTGYEVSDGENLLPLALPEAVGGYVEAVVMPDAGTLVLAGREPGIGNELFAAHAPRADAGGPYTVAPGATIELDAGATQDPNVGEVLTFQWDLDGDGIFGEVGVVATRGDEGGPVVQLDAAGLAPGSYAVPLRVTNGFAPLGFVGEATADVIVQATQVGVQTVVGDDTENDQWTVRQSLGNVQVYRRFGSSLVLEEEWPSSEVRELRFVGLGGDDRVSVFASLPLTKITFEGGDGTDTLLYTADNDEGVGGSFERLEVYGGTSLLLTEDLATDVVELGEGSRLTLAAGGSLELRTQQLLMEPLFGDALDLMDNALLVEDGDPAALSALLKSARDGGAQRWRGPGIGTSAATANTGLALVQQNAADVLVKYTYDGDANGDGVVNADDYFRIDSGFLAQPGDPTYDEGDFNYDGSINADDYFLIDSAFLAQGNPLSADAPVAAATAQRVRSVMALAPDETRTRKRAKVIKHREASVFETRPRVAGRQGR